MFACPYCGHTTQERPDAKQSQWNCRYCHASSISFIFIRNLTGPDYVVELRRREEATKVRDGKPCPHCQKKMARVHSPEGGRQVELDVCGKCSLVWFDPGEVISALERLGNAPNTPQRVATRARATEYDILSFEEVDYQNAMPAILGFPAIDAANAPPIEANPYVTLFLAIAMVMTSFAAFSHLERSARTMAFVPAARHHGATWILAIFLHADWRHLLGNLVFLILFAPAVESCIGVWRYLALFFGGGIAGHLILLLLTPHSMTYHLGASAAIAAVLAHYALLFPDVRVSFFRTEGVFFTWRIQLPAATLVCLFVLMNIIGSFLQVQNVGDVSYLSHLGGLMVGWLIPRPPKAPPSRVEADKTAVRRKN